MKLVRFLAAALIVFGAGAVSGYWWCEWRSVVSTARAKDPPLPRVAGWYPPAFQRVELLRRASKEVGLSEEQSLRVSTAVAQARRHLRELYQPLAAPARKELETLQASVMSELSPEQQRRFDEWLDAFRRRNQEARRQGALGRTNTPSGR